MEQHIVGTEEDILHHHVLIPLELGIRRQAVCSDRQHLFPIDRNAGSLAALRPRLGLPPFLFRGMVLAGRWGRVGLDCGCTLLPLESVDLVTQALVLCLGRPQVGHDVFQHVEELLDELARSFICDTVQVKIFKHIAAGSRRRRLRISSAIMPAVPRRGNPLEHGLSAPNY
jgi:hypothetical protein